MDRNKDCLLLPNQDDLRLGSGHSSIEQIPPQHDIVLFQKRNNDDRILLSLALMNGRTVAFPIFIEDIHANARGYELLYQSEVASNGQ